jgi:hypothetical protein
MVIRICTILAGIFLVLPVPAAYPAVLGKREPIAQVYEIQGKAMVKDDAIEGKTREIKQGSLLGLEDFLSLDKGSSLGLYFKSGGKKEVQAKNAPSVYKVADLLPQAQAYEQTVPVFGAKMAWRLSRIHPASFIRRKQSCLITPL